MWGCPSGGGKKHNVLEPPRAIMMEKPVMITEAPEWDYTLVFFTPGRLGRKHGHSHKRVTARSNDSLPHDAMVFDW
jgi:hypothetical protein